MAIIAVARRALGGLALAWLLLGLVPPTPALAQGVELAALRASRADGGLTLEFAARIRLPRPVEDALQRGVPVYFVAQAQLNRSRWYWRDERVGRVTRQWRVAFQPLTGLWRVSLGGLNQTFNSLPEALAVASSASNWRLAEAGQIEGARGLYVEFEYRLDTSQLPGPVQFGVEGSSDWVVRVQRSLRVD